MPDTVFTLWQGALTLHRSHHNPSEDPLWLLSTLAPSALPHNILDAGSGSGVMALSLALAYPSAATYGLDKNPTHCQQAQHNACLNDLSTHFIAGNTLQPPFKQHSFDLVVSNPPFYLDEQPRQRTQEHHTTPAMLTEWFQALINVLTPTGQLSLVLHADAAKALTSARKESLLNGRCIWLETQPNHPPKRVIWHLSQTEAWAEDTLTTWAPAVRTAHLTQLI